jgi:hypothetical protein
MVPESHEISFTATDEVRGYISSPEFTTDVIDKMQSQHLVDVSHLEAPADQANAEFLVLNYTRNDAGGLKDAIDFLISILVVKGLDATTVKGLIPRPKSDSFEDSLPYFESKLLHRGGPSGTDSPTRPQFSTAESEGGGTPSAGFFSKFRKPGSMSSFTSFMERRSKNNNGNGGGTHSPASSPRAAATATSGTTRPSTSPRRRPWRRRRRPRPRRTRTCTATCRGNRSRRTLAAAS